jgi:hypothetical protein
LGRKCQITAKSYATITRTLKVVARTVKVGPLGPQVLGRKLRFSTFLKFLVLRMKRDKITRIYVAKEMSPLILSLLLVGIVWDRFSRRIRLGPRLLPFFHRLLFVHVPLLSNCRHYTDIVEPAIDMMPKQKVNVSLPY